tara:strand:- start:393 stop:959 length:567 start_codon:yes stop_codon:yes gene_type:complete
MKLLFLDTETTGLSADRHEIIEYAAILYENDQEVRRVEQKVRPLHISTAHPKALQINGYSPEKWRGAITQEQAAKELSELLKIEDVIMVGHNPRFDLRFIKKLLLKHYPDQEVKIGLIDTKSLALSALAPMGLKSSSMDNIRLFLGWDFVGSHTALKDTEDVIKLFYLCRKEIATESWKNKLDLIEYT